MTDEHDLTVHAVNRGLRGCDVIGQAFGRILNGQDVIALVLQNFVNARPARAIHKPAVNKHNRLLGFGVGGVFPGLLLI